VTGADQHHPALRIAHQPHTAQDEGAHDDLADVRLGLDQPGEATARHTDDAAVLAGDAADQDLAIVEQVELAGELARAMDVDDALLAACARVRDLDRAFDDDEEVDAPLAAGEQMRALGNASVSPKRRSGRPAPRSASGKVWVSRL
jgi:hypothetical protein